MKQHKINDLIEAYVEGTISDADVLYFETQIKENPEVADKLALALKNDIFLKQLTCDGDVDSKVIKLNRPIRKRPTYSKVHKSSNWIYPSLLAIASCLILGFILNFVLNFEKEQNSVQVIPEESHSITKSIEDVKIGILIMTGKVILERDGFTQQMRLNDHLQKGDILECLENSRIKFKLKSEGTFFHLDPKSKMVLLDDKGKKWKLLEGGVGSLVSKQIGPERVKVLTDKADYEILGTIFHIESDESKSKLKVMEGKVKMTRGHDQKAVYVPGGSFASTEDKNLTIKKIGVASGIKMEVLGLTLINPEIQLPYAKFQKLETGAIIEASKLKMRDFNLDIHTRPSRVGSVFIEINGPNEFYANSTESYYPYSLGNKTKAISEQEPPNYESFSLTPGEYTVKATPYQHMNRKGHKGETKVFIFSVK